MCPYKGRDEELAGELSSCAGNCGDVLKTWDYEMDV